MKRGASELRNLLISFGALYLVSAAALSAIGRPAAVPWGFLPYLAFVALPLALAIGAGLALLPESLDSRKVALPWRFVCVVAGGGGAVSPPVPFLLGSPPPSVGPTPPPTRD